MEEIKEGYKIVYHIIFPKEDQKYLSAFILPSSIEYKINEWVYPRIGNGPLAIFSDLKDAIYYLKETSNNPHEIFLEIFKCKYTESQHKTLWYLDEDKNPFTSAPFCIPITTIYADKIMLLEEIKIHS